MRLSTYHDLPRYLLRGGCFAALLSAAVLLSQFAGAEMPSGGGSGGGAVQGGAGAPGGGTGVPGLLQNGSSAWGIGQDLDSASDEFSDDDRDHDYVPPSHRWRLGD